MKTLSEIAATITDQRHNVTKSNDYWLRYETYFSSLRNENLRIAEVGVFSGESMKILSSYFPHATLLGVDLHLQDIDFSGHKNIRYEQCDQSDSARLSALVNSFAPDGLDIVIDDASHLGSLSLATFGILFPKMKKGGLYIVEDWGTGFWDDWPDGSRYQEHSAEIFDGHLPKRIVTHDFGMVGFIKHLVDLAGMSDVRPNRTSKQERRTPLEFLHLYHGMAIAKKAGPLPI